MTIIVKTIILETCHKKKEKKIYMPSKLSKLFQHKKNVIYDKCA